MGVSQSPSCQNMAGTLESGEGSFMGAVPYFFGRTRLITWPCQWRLCNSTTHPPPPQLVPRWAPGVVTGDHRGPWIGEILKGEFVGRGQAVLSFTWMILLGRNGSEQKLPELYASFIESELKKKKEWTFKGRKNSPIGLSWRQLLLTFQTVSCPSFSYVWLGLFSIAFT